MDLLKSRKLQVCHIHFYPPNCLPYGLNLVFFAFLASFLKTGTDWICLLVPVVRTLRRWPRSYAARQVYTTALGMKQSVRAREDNPRGRNFDAVREGLETTHQAATDSARDKTRLFKRVRGGDFATGKIISDSTIRLGFLMDVGRQPQWQLLLAVY